MQTPAPAFKRILYYSSRKGLADQFFGALKRVQECEVRRRSRDSLISCAHMTFRVVVRHSVQQALDTLHREFFNLVLVDLREPVRSTEARGHEFQRGLALLDAMDREPDIERRYGFHRILVLVSGADALEVDSEIATLGARGVGRVMRDLSTCHLHEGCEYLPRKSEFARQVLGAVAELTQHRSVGKMALCASGGGITGLYFEMGSLKCLEDCCSPGALNSFDLYFGISAGSVLAGMLANGFTVGEFMGAVAGAKGGRIPPLDLNLLDLAHVDTSGITAPLRQLFTLLRAGAAELLRMRLPFTLESLVFEYGDLIHAPFNTGGFGSLLERAFARPGHTNDFRRLQRGLYIGATDQDRKEHVLFGEPPFDTVPISLAIQASMSLNPVFAPTEIGGRFYEDGAVTRTSNFVDAIKKGADLIFALDPLVPYVPKDAGYSRSRGVVYNADQDIRTVSYTRYETTRNWVLRKHPHVSMYTFLPANQIRRIMSVNPMDHRPFIEIWRGAYLSTLRRIHALGYRMRGDLAFHGIPFDTARADAVAARLVAARTLRFEDFFPDGRIDIGDAHPPGEQAGIAAA